MLIDWFTVAAQAVNFLLLVWLLKRFLYKPVLAALDAREKGIAQQLQDAAAKKAEAATEQADFQNKNKEFEEKRAALLLGATQAAESERKKLLETVRSDAEALRAKLQKNAAEEFGTLNQKIATLAAPLGYLRNRRRPSGRRSNLYWARAAELSLKRSRT